MTLNKTLKYIGISHKTATISQREMFHISEQEKETLSESICDAFLDITGLFILATCNRTEIYFESTTTSAAQLRDFIIFFKLKKYSRDLAGLFNCSDDTELTVKHLLEVASGLESMVLGDAEIVHQIKKAHQFSMAHHMQGSLLERALQSVFKSHKRISNETHFRDGTTSVAYKSLKVIHSIFGKNYDKHQKILFIGAGDIVKQLFKYNSKFNYSNIYISNRTQEKAEILAKNNNCLTYDWNKVVNNDFQDFDVVISAASNCHHLIHKVEKSVKKRLFIDLAIPSNIDKNSILRNNVFFYDLDLISVDLEETKEKRLAAVDEVNTIIAEEFEMLKIWLDEASLRNQLLKSKSTVEQKIIAYFNNQGEELDEQTINELTNIVMRKLMAQPNHVISHKKMDSLIARHASKLNQV